MNWTKGVNPRLLRGGNGFHALAHDSPNGKGGCVARIYKDHPNPACRDHILVPGTARRGGTIETALQVCVKAFDARAVFVDEEKP